LCQIYGRYNQTAEQNILLFFKNWSQLVVSCDIKHSTN